MLNQLNKQIVTNLNLIEQISLATSRNMNVRSLLDDEEDNYLVYQQTKIVEESLRSIVYSTSILESIDVYLRKEVPAVTGGTPVVFKKFDRIYDEHWDVILEKNDFAWIPEKQNNTNNNSAQVIRFIRKIRAFAGQNEGVLVFNVKSSAIRTLMQSDDEHAQERQTERILLDSGGRAVIGIEQLPAEMMEQGHLYRQIYSGKSNYARVQLENAKGGKKDEALVVWSQLKDPNWVLVEVTPWKQITEGSVRIALLLVLIGIAAILFALVITLIIARQFTNPIRLLLRAMKRFDKTFVRSNQDSMLPKDYRNEFGHVFMVYEDMLERIQELYRYLKNRYIRQKEVEIQALQAMINPHFLYNTLDQANWMAIEAGQHQISKVLELMGQMFRIGLSKGDYLIKVSEELEYVRCYMELQCIRLGDQIEYSVEVSETLKELYILKLTLQPFVENAVIHGLQYKESGSIRIRAEETLDGILFTVADDGGGMQENWQSRSERKTGGYGIQNVQDRLHSYFDAPYGIHFESEAGKGTKVYILQPKISNSEEWRNRNVENGNYRR